MPLDIDYSDPFEVASNKALLDSLASASTYYSVIPEGDNYHYKIVRKLSGDVYDYLSIRDPQVSRDEGWPGTERLTLGQAIDFFGGLTTGGKGYGVSRFGESYYGE